jgi:hypothetical protein
VDMNDLHSRADQEVIRAILRAESDEMITAWIKAPIEAPIKDCRMTRTGLNGLSADVRARKRPNYDP